MAAKEQTMIPGETIDLDDDLRLTNLVDLVQKLLDLPIYVSVLTIDQWRRMIEHLAADRDRPGRRLHLHVLPDPRPGNEHHLLVSPMAVRAINSGRGPEVAETVSALIAISGTTPPPVIRSGLNDLLLSAVARRSDLKFPTGLNPRDRQFVYRLISALTLETPYSMVEWLREIKQEPAVLFQALRRTRFAAYWVKHVKANEPQLAAIFDSYTHNKTAFVAELEKAMPTDEIVRVTDKLLQTWLPMERQRQSDEREQAQKEATDASQ
jgi:hypothetical protein